MVVGCVGVGGVSFLVSFWSEQQRHERDATPKQIHLMIPNLLFQTFVVVRIKFFKLDRLMDFCLRCARAGSLSSLSSGRLLVRAFVGTHRSLAAHRRRRPCAPPCVVCASFRTHKRQSEGSLLLLCDLCCCCCCCYCAIVPRACALESPLQFVRVSTWRRRPSSAASSSTGTRPSS